MRYSHVDHSRIAYPSVQNARLSGVLTWEMLKKVYKQEDGVELRAISRTRIRNGEEFGRFARRNSQAYRIRLYRQEKSGPGPASFMFKVQNDRQRSLSASVLPPLSIKAVGISERTRRNKWCLVVSDKERPFYVYFDNSRRLLYVGAKDRLSVFIVGRSAYENKDEAHTTNGIGYGFNTDAVETLTKKTLDEAKVNATLMYMQPVDP